MKTLNAQIFLEKANGSSMGRWYSLPMNEETLKDLLYNQGLIITDYSFDYNFATCEVTKEAIIDFNYVLNQNDSKLLTLYMSTDKNLEDAEDILADLDNPCFLYLEDIENGTESEINVQIGEKLVEMGFLGHIPSLLIEKDYIDYEAIGRDYWLGSVSHYEESTKAVFMQISSRQ